MIHSSSKDISIKWRNIYLVRIYALSKNIFLSNGIFIKKGYIHQVTIYSLSKDIFIEESHIHEVRIYSSRKAISIKYTYIRQVRIH